MTRALRSSLAFAVFGLSLITSALVGACSGGEFTEAGASAGAGGSPAGTAGSSPSAGTGTGTGAMSGGTVLCAGPADCDDGNPCTIDECGAEGSCVYTPKCAAGERCCDGTCGQCCAQADCVDGVSCTTDQCFNLFCAYVPDDGACGMNQYCHRSESCKDREQCPNGTAAECDDDDPCTTDTCNGGLCYHEDCSGGEQCCEGGCAMCCGDGGCPDDGDPCTQETCQSGTCASGELCAGQLCCEGVDGATCGACCDQGDCDDGVDCTEDGCAGGQCSNVANDDLCGSSAICDPEQGCIPVAMCNGDADCVSADPCKTGSCVQGKCEFQGCSNGLDCCPGVGCRDCCDNSDCDDALCCGGVCQECCSLYDCNDISTAIPPLGECQSNTCIGGLCQVNWVSCDFGFCCPPHGCSQNECSVSQ